MYINTIDKKALQIINRDNSHPIGIIPFTVNNAFPFAKARDILTIRNSKHTKTKNTVKNYILSDNSRRAKQLIRNLSTVGFSYPRNSCIVQLYSSKFDMQPVGSKQMRDSFSSSSMQHFLVRPLICDLVPIIHIFFLLYNFFL